MNDTASLSLVTIGNTSPVYATNGDTSAVISAYLSAGSWGTAVIRIEGSNDRSAWSDTGVSLSAVGISSVASIAAYAYIRTYVVTAQAGAYVSLSTQTYIVSGYATIPVALDDLDPAGASDGDVVVLDGGVWTAGPGGGGTVISGSVNVTMTGDSGTATFSDAGITSSTIITAAIAGVTTADHDPEDHMAEELQVYAVNQGTGSVGVTIISPNGDTSGVYKVYVIGV